MDRYFHQLLERLDKLSGLKQYQKLLESEDPAKEIGELIDTLVAVCRKFPMIPDDDKQDIINRMVVEDQSFTSLNARVVFKWLVDERDGYIKPPKEEPTSKAEPLTGEERKKKIEEVLRVFESRPGPPTDISVQARIEMKRKLAFGDGDNKPTKQ